MPGDTPTLTMTILEFAALARISRDAAYDAAGRGEIPTVRIGSRLLVLRIPAMRMLGVDPEATSSGAEDERTGSRKRAS